MKSAVSGYVARARDEIHELQIAFPFTLFHTYVPSAVPTQSSHLSHCHENRCTPQHFSANTEYEIVKWVRKRWNPSLQCQPSMFSCVTTEGRRESNLFACENRILIRYIPCSPYRWLVWMENETHTFVILYLNGKT